MNETAPFASFIDHWRGRVRFDLSGSDSETLPLAQLLALAGSDDVYRWENLVFGYADPRGALWLRNAIAVLFIKLGQCLLNNP